MNARDELRDGVRWAEKELNLDVDVRAHVFELTIRSLGGLLSAHSLLVRDSSLVPGQCSGAALHPVPGMQGSVLQGSVRGARHIPTHVEPTRQGSAHPGFSVPR